MPSDHKNAIRREGVGIALDEKATAAWRAAGEAWEAGVGGSKFKNSHN